MPNRIIKESICTSRKINSLSAEEEVFFYRLLVNCDDYGCFYGDPDVLGGMLYTRRKMQDAKIKKLRDAVVAVGLAYLYEQGGETYICITQWEEHQRIRNKRRKFPEPTEENMIHGNSLTIDSNLLTNDSNSPQSAAPARAGACELDWIGLDSIVDSKDKSNNTGDSNTGDITTRARGEILAERFDEFWSAYPRKVKKVKAREAWMKIKPSAALHQKILAAVEAAKNSRQWKKDNGDFIPHPTSWLNQGRWEDELPDDDSSGDTNNPFLKRLRDRGEE